MPPADPTADVAARPTGPAAVAEAFAAAWNAADADALAELGEERFARLRLARTDRVGPVAFSQLLARHGSALAALDALPQIVRRSGGSLTPPAPERIETELTAGERIGADGTCSGSMPSSPAGSVSGGWPRGRAARKGGASDRTGCPMPSGSASSAACSSSAASASGSKHSPAAACQTQGPSAP